MSGAKVGLGYTYEIKAPNVIHLLMEGQERREIRLDTLYIERFNTITPLAMAFSLSTDHKDIHVPKDTMVLYVDKTMEATAVTMDYLVGRVVQELVEMIHKGVLYKPFTLQDHVQNYAMTTSTRAFRLGNQFGQFTDARIQAHFVPSKLNINNYTLKVSGIQGSQVKLFTLDKNPNLHPVNGPYLSFLEWFPSAVVK